MTKKMNNKPSAKRKLLPAIGMLTVSAMMLSSSTYAWFTMNDTVSVSGMTVKTKVSSNLLIAQENSEANYTTAIAQTRNCLLEPTSSINASSGSFWYTVKASADGNKLSNEKWVAYSENAESAVANETAGKANYDPAFNTAYGTGKDFTSANINMTTGEDSRDGAAYGYVDYVFYLKATSTAENQQVVMTNCNLLYNSKALGTIGESTSVTDKAWRVAVLSQSSASDTTTAGDGDLVSILAPSGAEYQSKTNDESTPVSQAVNGADSRAAVTSLGSKAVIDNDIDAGATEYYKVTVRLWLEGEDKTCTSETFAKLTNNYTLDLEFKLQNDDSGAVTEIKSVPAS